MAMIDAFYIFTKGGLLLWSTQFVKVKGNPLDWLIKEVLLEERMGEATAKKDEYGFKWKLVNEMDLFFVVVYQGILQIAYLEGLLSMVAKEFLSHVADAFGNGLSIKHVDFDSAFLECRRKVDKEALESKRPKNAKSFTDAKKGTAAEKSREEKSLPGSSPENAKKGKSGEGGDDDDEAKGGGKGKNGKKEPAEEKTKKVKQNRHWDGDGKFNKKLADELDFSKNKPNDSKEALDAQKAAFLGDSDDEQQWAKAEDEVESLSSGSASEAEEEAKEEVKQKPGRVNGLFKTLTRGVKNLTGDALLTDEDLAPILKTFKTELMSKNVAADVANQLADSVRTSLVGKRTARLTSMTSTVKTALQEAMETLLTPKKSVDVLRAAMAAKNTGRVYTVVFLGVNGVGKSTNLAKVAYYLKHKGGLDVLICACDTFRAGAVEQLKTHSRCLDVPVFERGYGKDPSDIAKAAIAHAKNVGHDVVLVDTAGRMQDNEPLMRALAKLVAVNTPDLVLFVGEALVGNDAIDQVSKFNRALIDYSHDRRNPRGIDGMLLTKYDTVDDKVGAALSMVYVTGQPIVFVGTGQKYTHLRKMQVKEVVKTLMG
mmetsp:Transcript_113810/g.317869  ORF Transcript_113810/g.317869 Transcript_113810/m.317869 type:complete len:597 (-) Transcript_113810:142-1932(-)|eukprot:CAMPEP_0176209882 /NCGR_PEP_ID=MMETSP0121_2-20121125/13859_1 /TAXON_ID=160619 /ORGANISM="Kryptoperidinium foliaceum, Strain CCMP 1326" /LENGTH=596 /DNA_ID=CAMNT_0017548901 /DNA_START=114 /DNA_END=1904 /DNA_ORIENTATION=+